jgi:hypothetical protein
MWAQYADGHRGVCLVLNHKLLHENIVSHFGADDLFSGPVEYLNTVQGPSSHLPHGGYDLVYLEDYVESFRLRWQERAGRRWRWQPVKPVG